MALLGREFIAVPDDRKGQIVFKWPDNNIRRYSRAIVDVDELALFVNKGEVIGTLSPGQHQIDADELPFLGAIVDHLTRQGVLVREGQHRLQQEYHLEGALGQRREVSLLKAAGKLPCQLLGGGQCAGGVIDT